MNKLSAIVMAVAVMMLGLANVASANPVCADDTVDLVLADATVVGDVRFNCRTSTVEVTIDTDGFGFVILEATADLVADVDCDREANGLPAYLNPQDNPRVGTGNSTAFASQSRGSRTTDNKLIVSPLELGLGEGDTMCLVVEAFLFNEDGRPRRVSAYNFGTDFAGPSPHMYQNFVLTNDCDDNPDNCI